jgi:ribonuclease HI
MGDDLKTTNPSINHEVTISTDGGARGNPGPSAAAYVIVSSNGSFITKGGSYLGITTNNQAEYQALKLGLEKAVELGARVVHIRMDSLLVVNQMQGIYKIKNRDLWPIHQNIKDILKHFNHYSFTHVPREENREADATVNQILDEQAK